MLGDSLKNHFLEVKNVSFYTPKRLKNNLLDPESTQIIALPT
jgi:hypothetical protein